jgi:predicted ATP-grasp superfamily ATP-dependent carboligase
VNRQPTAEDPVPALLGVSDADMVRRRLEELLEDVREIEGMKDEIVRREERGGGGALLEVNETVRRSASLCTDQASDLMRVLSLENAEARAEALLGAKEKVDGFLRSHPARG